MKKKSYRKSDHRIPNGFGKIGKPPSQMIKFLNFMPAGFDLWYHSIPLY